jgi:hypothetical protein
MRDHSLESEFWAVNVSPRVQPAIQRRVRRGMMTHVSIPTGTAVDKLTSTKGQSKRREYEYREYEY